MYRTLVAILILSTAQLSIASVDPALEDPDSNDVAIWVGHKQDEALVGHWKLNEFSGRIASDASRKANDGCLVNGPFWKADMDGNRCLCLGGMDDYVDCGNNSVLNLTGDLTVTAWICPEGYGRIGNSCLLSKGEAPEGFGFYLVGDHNRLAFRAGTRETLSDTEVLRMGKWQHIAVTFDDANDVVAFYVDGQPVGTASNMTDPTDANDAPLLIGNTVSLDSGFKGMLRDVRLYSRSLAADEIALMFPTRYVSELKSITFQFPAEDGNGNPLTYALQAGQVLPAGASFTDGRFFWRPRYGQAGSYDLTFELAAQPELTQSVRIVVEKLSLEHWYGAWLHSLNAESAPEK